jgi:DNA-binding beta-propeller fold protein YncE
MTGACAVTRLLTSLVPLAAALGAAACGGGARTSVAVPPGAIMASAPAPTRDYHVFVASEAVDEVALIRFGPDGAAVDRKRVTGMNRADPDGPHGVAVAPDGRHYYVTTAHGTPNGILWKYRTDNDELVGRTELGQFPASLQVSPDGFYAYVVNFNLHGDMVPSSVSVVSTNEMVEIARLQTCTMPHGSRLNSAGTRHYSTCMMDEMLIEIDTRGLEVARHFMLTPGGEHGMAGAPGAHGGHGGGHEDHGTGARCSPTWATPSADGARVFVACNASSDIADVDVASWTLTRRIAAGEGVYNLDVTKDGRLLIATNKRGRSVSVFDVATGTELKRIETQRPVVHGIAISDDDRYAFISVEGYGAEPGTVEVIDLRALVRVASVDVGQMAGGIAFWK